MSAPLLAVRDLTVVFRDRKGNETRAVDGVSLDVRAGETVAVVGESGCGKTVTSLALLGLLPDKGVDISGAIEFDGRNLLELPDEAMRRIRGREIAMIFQDPMTSLNPVLTVGRQIVEVLELHTELHGDAAYAEAADLLARVGIPDPGRRLRDYPHQLSGGMRQRAMIAMALACSPRLLIADEPTTALDVTIQAQILGLLRDLVANSGTALVLITHDLGVVAGMCETVHVMYAGRVVERAGRRELFARPRHPDPAGLLASVPRLDAPRGVPLHPIAGSPRDTIPWRGGCAFSPRCPHAQEDCVGGPPALEPDLGEPGHEVRCLHPVALPEPAPPPAPAKAPRKTTRRRSP
jgi:peptide/nickel transport system ATP-binding protein